MTNGAKTAHNPFRSLGLKSWLLAPVAIFLVTCVLYGGTLTIPFVLDDHHVILQNPAIANLAAHFDTSFFSRPRSLVDLTFAIQYALHGTEVTHYHLFNILVHAANGILVYLLSLLVWERLPKTHPMAGDDAHPRFFALATALIFISHPIQTQAVNYVAQRYTSMSAFFSLGSIIAYLKLRSTQPRSAPPPKSWLTSARGAWGPSAWAVTCLTSAYAAFLCKQNALALPLLFLLMEGLLFSDTRRFWRAKLWWAVPSVLVLAVAISWNVGLLANHVDPAHFLRELDRLSRETQQVSRTTYLLTQLRVVCIYMALLILPVYQSLDWRYPFVHSLLEGWTPLAMCIWGALFCLLWIFRRRSPLISLAVAWFFAAQAVESTLIPIRDALFEHRLYLPSLGYAWLLAFAFTRWRARNFHGALAGLCLLLTALSSATLIRHTRWKDPVLLWQEAIQKNPRNFRAYNNLGRIYLDRNQLDRALPPLQEALALCPWRLKIHTNLAEYFARQNDWPQAAHYARSAIELDPSTASHYYNLGYAYHRMGWTRRAADLYRCALLLNPNYTKPAVNLANLHLGAGRLAEARSLLKTCVERDPTDVRARVNLAIVLARSGQWSPALAHLERALQFAPDAPEILLHKATILLRLGKREEAQRLLRRLQRESTDNPTVLQAIRRLQHGALSDPQ